MRALGVLVQTAAAPCGGSTGGFSPLHSDGELELFAGFSRRRCRSSCPARARLSAHHFCRDSTKSPPKAERLAQFRVGQSTWSPIGSAPFHRGSHALRDEGGGGGGGEPREPQCREMVKRKRTKKIVDGSEGSNRPPPTTHTSRWCRPHMEETRRVSSFGP